MMILSVGIASWDDTYESITPTTRSDGGDRSERVQAALWVRAAHINCMWSAPDNGLLDLSDL